MIILESNSKNFDINLEKLLSKRKAKIRLSSASVSKIVSEVKKMVDQFFPDHPGDVKHFWLGTSRKEALKVITQKNLGTLIVKNNKGNTSGLITDGTIRRASEKNTNLQKLTVKKIMTKNPISVNQDILCEKALEIAPEDLTAKVSLSRILVAKGDKEGAEKATAEARILGWKEVLKD